MVKNIKREKKKEYVSAPAVEIAPPAPRWGDWRTWLNIGFLFIALGIAVYCIEQAKWISPQPPLTLILFFSIVFVWLFNAVRLPGWITHIPAVVTGLLVTVWAGMALLPGDAGAGRLLTVFGSWVKGGGLQEAEAKAIFGTSLVLITWLVGYLSAWFLLRRGNAWVGVGLGLTVVIVNISNLAAKNYFFFTLFLLASVLLVLWTRSAGRNTSVGRAAFSGKSLFYLIASLLCITVISVSVSWFTPQLRIPALQDALAASMPWKQNLQSSDFNILNSVPSKFVVATAAGIQELDFGETWHESDDIKYTVKSPQPAYWQVNVYDTYNSDSWSTSPVTEETIGKKTNWDDETADGRDKLVYEVTAGINTDVILLTGEFASAEMPVIAARGPEGGIIAVKSPRVLASGEKYTVRAYVSDSSPAVLNASGVDYPDGIEDAYLQLPPGFPAQIKTLSENITRTAHTPYEKVVALDDYLSSIPYSKSVVKLPEGADAVADFLFTQKKGFCIHFASAMSVMLRSVGVPARLVVGYLPGDRTQERNVYVLRDKHYHAWTQVYFPGQGWIDFEATPSGQESRVYIETPLVSEPGVRQIPDWYGWYYPEGAGPGGREIEDVSPGVNRYPGGALSFSDELGWAALVIICALAAFALAFGISRIVRPLNAARIWHVDRNNLAVSIYDSLCRLAAMHKMAPEARQTPLEFSSRIAEIIPEQAKELDYLMKAYLEDRFGPVKGKPELYMEAEILKARVRVYNAILGHRGKWHKFLWTS